MFALSEGPERSYIVRRQRKSETCAALSSSGTQYESMRFHSIDDAMGFLVSKRSLPDDNIGLRSLMSTSIHRLCDRDERNFLRVLAAEIVSGELCVLVVRRPIRKIEAIVCETAVPAASRAAPTAVRRAPSPPLVVEPSDFRDSDEEAQVATLIAAAKSGTPFCEMCEKARRRRTA